MPGMDWKAVDNLAARRLQPNNATKHIQQLPIKQETIAGTTHAREEMISEDSVWYWAKLMSPFFGGWTINPVCTRMQPYHR
jgi:hypothetical protein